MGEPSRRCRCCQLDQPPAIDRATGTRAPVCARCTNHQGDQGTNPLRRAQAHESMLRQRLEQSMAAEAEARRQAAEAQVIASRAPDSRNRLAKRVVEAVDQADPRAGIPQIASDPDVRKWAWREDENDVPFYRSST